MKIMSGDREEVDLSMSSLGSVFTTCKYYLFVNVSQDPAASLA